MRRALLGLVLLLCPWLVPARAAAAASRDAYVFPVYGPGRPAPGYGRHHGHGYRDPGLDDPLARGAWNLGAGAFQAAEKNGLDATRVEFRSDLGVLGVARWLGGVTTGPVDFVLPYLGFYRDVPLGGGLVFTPATAFGFLSGGDAARFGGTLQFRTSLELGYTLGDGSRLGLAIQHVSNAGLEQPNKGSNTQMLTWTLPFGRHRDGPGSRGPAGR